MTQDTYLPDSTGSALSPATRRMLLIELGFVGIAVVVPDLVVALGQFFGAERAVPNSTYAVISHVAFSLQIAATILFVQYRSGEPWSRFGIVRPNLLHDVPIGMLAFVIACVVSIFVVPVLRQTFGSLDNTDPVPFVKSPDPSLIHSPMLALGWIMNALAEELAMRSYFVTRFLQLGVRTTGAVLLSATIFGSYHIYQGPSGAIIATLIGMIFGWMFVGVGRLWPFVFAHLAIDLCWWLGTG